MDLRKGEYGEKERRGMKEAEVKEGRNGLRSMSVVRNLLALWHPCQMFLSFRLQEARTNRPTLILAFSLGFGIYANVSSAKFVLCTSLSLPNDK